MAYCGLLPLAKQVTEVQLETLLSDFVSNMEPDNETMQALQKIFALGYPPAGPAGAGLLLGDQVQRRVLRRPGELCAGGPGVYSGSRGYAPYRSIAEEAMADGSRVLLFAACKPGPNGRGIPPLPLAFVLLRNPVRENAKETFAYFHDQGVTVKGHLWGQPRHRLRRRPGSGDCGAERYIDASTLETYEDIEEACEEYNVFGRVKPNQKKLLIQAPAKRRPHGGHDRRRRQ